MMNDEIFMKEAIRLSQLAVGYGSEPFGTMLVEGGGTIFSNENQIYTNSDPTFRAEAGLLQRFYAETHITDLREYTLYSSCEPRFMYCGAIVWTKLGRLVYGAGDIDLYSILHEKGAECCKTVLEHSPWKPQVTSGVPRDGSLRILTVYFSENTKGWDTLSAA